MEHLSDEALASELAKRGWLVFKKASRSEQDRIARDRRRELADLVSEGMSLAAAGRHLGVSRQRASQMWQRLISEMGA